MSFACLPSHMRGRREKLFGDGRPVPMDRNAKARIMTLAQALRRRTEPGKAYGILTAKFVDVLKALLWGFHNASSGLCFPSYGAIAEKAGCARSTVYEAIQALEKAGILTWVNRITRVREVSQDLFGRVEGRWRVLRTSNAYSFVDPKPGTGSGRNPQENARRASKSESQTGTVIQVSSLPETGLQAALTRLRNAMNGAGPGVGKPAAADLPRRIMTDESVAHRCVADLPAAEDGDPLPEAPALEPRAPVSLLDRPPDGCCYIVATAPYLYCPEQRRPRSSYCARHHRVVWQRGGWRPF